LDVTEKLKKEQDVGWGKRVPHQSRGHCVLRIERTAKGEQQNPFGLQTWWAREPLARK